MKAKLNEAEGSLVQVQGNLEYLENQSRRNNIRVSGIPEAAGETWEDAENKVKDAVKSTLGLEIDYNQLPNDYNQLGVCRDSDPDDNFYESFNCEYFIEDKFNDSIAKNYTDDKLSLLHLNTRSLSGSFDKVTNLLFSLNLHFSVIGISETWSERFRSFLQYPWLKLCS